MMTLRTGRTSRVGHALHLGHRDLYYQAQRMQEVVARESTMGVWYSGCPNWLHCPIGSQGLTPAIPSHIYINPVNFSPKFLTRLSSRN